MAKTMSAAGNCPKEKGEIKTDILGRGNLVMMNRILTNGMGGGVGPPTPLAKYMTTFTEQ